MTDSTNQMTCPNCEGDNVEETWVEGQWECNDCGFTWAVDE